jgi:hypothetical protein
MSLEELLKTVIPRDSQRTFIADSNEDKTKKDDRLSYKCERVLDSINSDPGLNMTQRVEALHWDDSELYAARDELLKNNFIEYYDPPKEKYFQAKRPRGKSPRYLLLTEAGQKYLVSKLGISAETLHGGLEHHCAILKLKAQYKTSFHKVVHHRSLGAYLVDLACENEQGKVVGIVEIIYSEHVEKDVPKVKDLVDQVEWVHVYFHAGEDLHKYHALLHATLSVEQQKMITLRVLSENQRLI